MDTAESVRLLDLEPDLGRFLTPADTELIGALCVPVVEIPAGELDLHALLTAHRAFAMLLIEGMLVRRIVVHESGALRLLGPGDIVSAVSGQSSMLISATGWRVATRTRLAVLGRDVLLAAHRAPRLVAGLHARGAEQADRVALQLAICQLPRVEDRVLSMLWLLAESWGQVTAHGTALRLQLTHETLGGLVGARRSTVTLALSQLTDDGAILRQERGWLLLEPPPVFDVAVPRHEILPELLAPLPVPPRPEPQRVGVDVASDLLGQVKALREVRAHLAQVRDQNQARIARDLERIRETRRRSVELRREARARRAEEHSAVLRLHHHDRAGDAVGASEREADDAAAEGLPAPVDGVED